MRQSSVDALKSHRLSIAAQLSHVTIQGVERILSRRFVTTEKKIVQLNQNCVDWKFL